ncbi:DUF4198 domain-containing protein [Actibacterium sp. MT2.3-13A]|uniref:DUF4198 domain-containing protein n=1 Tax=Actibacterium sp. MT2.3-13A TaxID=2828332 RepID=UPI001BAC5EA4|nr:DUF4198 domain-containing protein [Actibacterium sp. MT2.3-13A]
MRILSTFLAAAGLLLSAPSSQAHEFWISPQSYQVAPGTPIVADIRVGQNFEGPAYSYLPASIARFDIVTGPVATPVTGRMGDRPALSQPAPAEGLAVIVHETADSRLTYSEWQKFANFVTHKALSDTLAQHAARGLPQTGFSETYRRYAKALVAVGAGAGADRALGLEIEIVALANPYTDALPEGLPVQVLYRGAPRAGAQLEVFDKAPSGAVAVTRLTLDAQGRATVPLTPGHEYLLDSVAMRAIGSDDPAEGPVWHSLWAALSFARPAR